MPCERCGAALQPSSRFCGQCGAPAQGGALAARPPPTIDAIVGGERKRISVLFADIRNSTALIDGVDPEAALRKIEPVLAMMKAAVHRYSGVVSEMLGDGVMALFGTPTPAEDHAVLACLAALAMQEGIPGLDDPDIGIRVGVHSGEVVVQTVQTSLATGLGAIGPAVHLANRMEQLAEVGGVYVTADTYNEARQYIEATHVGAMAVKGIGAPVNVYRVVGVRSAPASEVFRNDTDLEPLSGRRGPIEELNAALALGEKGMACVVGVSGEAGMGKSRLCYEFAEMCRRRDIFVLEARATPFGQAMPFQPVLDLLRDYFAIRSISDVETIRQKVADRLQLIGADMAVAPLVLDFLGVAQDPATRRLDPGVRKARLIEFICALARAAANDGASVVLIEDLHWIDSGSVEFIEALAESVAHTRTTLVLNFRPGVMLSVMQRSHYRPINLGPLDAGSADELIVRSIGRDRSTDELRRALALRSQGNPLFLQELIRAVVEGGGLQGVHGAYRATANAQLANLPPNVQGLLASRIDRLDPRAKQLLHIAAVIGREAPVAVLADVAGVARADLAEPLRNLRLADLAYELPRANDAILIIRHPLIQEVAYRSLLSERKRLLHAAVAAAVQTHFKDRLDENAGLVALHLEQAGDAKKAAQFLMRSAIWVGANDPRQALAAWKKVAQILRDQPAATDTDYMLMMACGQVVNFGWREGIPVAEAREFFEKASGLAAALANMRANALIHAAYGRILAAAGSTDEYVEKVLQARALVGVASDPSLEVTLDAVLCHALRLAGRLPDALAINDKALARVHQLEKFDRDMLGFDVEPWLLTTRGYILVLLGRFEDARPSLDRVIAMDSSKIDATHHFIPHLAYVEWAWSCADPDSADRHSARALDMAEASGSPYMLVYARWARALALLAAGANGEAASFLEDALALAREKRAGLENEARILADLSSAVLAHGDAPRALDLADQAIAVAQTRRARVPECRAHMSRAQAMDALGDPVGAGAEREIVARLLDETGADLFRPMAAAGR